MKLEHYNERELSPIKEINMKRLQVEITEEYYKSLDADKVIVVAEMTGIDKAELAMLNAQKKDLLAEIGKVNKLIENIWTSREQ